MKVFLAGPIDYWWNENWGTPAHEDYKLWRQTLNNLLVESGHLVYRPHEAMKGAWDEAMQEVNNAALRLCDVVIYMTPLGVPAYGTRDECEYAAIIGKPVLWAPPWCYGEIADIVKPLADPYSDVNRKSYTKEADRA